MQEIKYCPKWCYAKHYGTPHAQCQTTTKKGKPCPHHADRLDKSGEPKCHIHDPEGTYRRKVREGTVREPEKGDK